MRTAAILPVKRFGAAKQRLGAEVPSEERVRLARAMAEDVLEALSRARSLAAVFVVSSEHTLAQAAADRGALLIADDFEGGQSAAVTLGVKAARAAGAERVLCVPGDCPGIDADELDELLRAPASGVVVIPDRHGTGTNGLLLTPPDAIEPAFGPGSCERHLALARAAGVAVQIARPRSLLLDVDTRADLDALRIHLASTGGVASRTLAALGDAPARFAALAADRGPAGA
jgi:2-phospho-L-lactate guanylyltransferase